MLSIIAEILTEQVTQTGSRDLAERVPRVILRAFCGLLRPLHSGVKLLDGGLCGRGYIIGRWKCARLRAIESSRSQLVLTRRVASMNGVPDISNEITEQRLPQLLVLLENGSEN